jgi:hypothetical protein
MQGNSIFSAENTAQTTTDSTTVSSYTQVDNVVEFAGRDLCRTVTFQYDGFVVKSMKGFVKVYNPVDKRVMQPDIWLPFGPYMNGSSADDMPILAAARTQEDVFTFYDKCYTDREIRDPSYEVIMKRIRLGHLDDGRTFKVNILVQFSEGLMCTVEVTYRRFGVFVGLVGGQIARYVLSDAEERILERKIIDEDLVDIFIDLDDFLFAESQRDYVWIQPEDWMLVAQSGVGKKKGSGQPKLCSVTGQPPLSPPRTPPRPKAEVTILRSPNRGRGVITDQDLVRKDKTRERERTISRRRDGKLKKNLAAFTPQSGLFDSFRTLSVKASPEVEQLAQRANTNLENLSVLVPELMTQLNAVAEQGVRVQHGLDTSVLHVPMFIATASCAIMAVRSSDKRWKYALGACGIAYAAYVAVEHKDWFSKQFNKIVSRTDEVYHDALEAQGFDQHLIHDVSGMFLGYMSLMTARKMPSGMKMASTINLLKDFDRTRSGITSAVSFACDLAQKIVNYFRTDVLGWNSLQLMEKTIPALRQWCDKVDVIFDEHHAGLLKVTASNAARVHNLLMEGHQLSAMRLNHVDSIQMRSAMSTYMTTLRRIADPFEKANLAGSGPRMEPVCVLFRGLPGVGKTYVLYPLIKKVLSRVLPAEERALFMDNYMDFVYNRQSEHKYWDGYRGQPAVIFDDFGQIRDAAGMPDNEYLEIIRAGNIHPYICHMADIGSKGNTLFKGKLILATTNQRSDFQPSSIWEPQAVMRRFDLIIDVGIKAQYAANKEASPLNRVIDRNCPDLADGKFNPDIYEFFVAQKLPDSGAIISSVHALTLEDIIDKLVDKYRDRESRMDHFMEHLDVIGRDELKLRAQAGLGNSSEPVRMAELVEFEKDFDRNCPPLEEEDLTTLPLEKVVERFSKKVDPAFIKWVQELESNQSWFSVRRVLMEHGGTLVDDTLKVLFGMNPTLISEMARRYPDILPAYIEEIVKTPSFAAKLRQLQQPDSGLMLRRQMWARDVVSRYSTSTTNLFKSLYDKFMWLADWQKALVVAGTIGTAIALFASPFRKSEKSDDAPVLIDDEVDEYVRDYSPLWNKESGPYPMRKSGRRASKFERAKLQVIHPQGGVDPNLPALVDKLVSKNQYELTLHGWDGRFGFLTMLYGRTGALPFHFIAQIKGLIEAGEATKDSTAYLHNKFADQLIPVPVHMLLDYKQDDYFKANDLAAVYLPHVHQHPDIRHYFVPEACLSKPIDMIVQLIGARRHGTKTIQVEKCTPAWIYPPQNVTTEEGSYSVRNCLYYEAYTSVGDCGMVAALQNRSVGPGKFIAIHVAGNSQGAGVGAIVTREALMAISELFPQQYPPPAQVVELEPQCMALPFKGNFVPYYDLPKEVSQPVDTKIRRSELYNLWVPTEKAPARLSRKILEDGTVLDPKHIAIEKYGGPTPVPDFELIQVASDFIFSEWLRFMSPNRQSKIYSFEEACEGIEGVDFCNAIPRGTSAGFPYVCNPKQGFRGKEWFFGKGERYDFSSPQTIALKEEVLECITKAKRGERSLHVYVDTLKDELRKKDRVRDCKTRLVSAAPLTYTILCRMFFLDFTIWLMKNNVNVGCGVGINPYSEDWDYLAKKMRSKGKHGLAGDFHGFDTSEYAALFEAICELINRWYDDGEENAQIRRVLFADLVNSIHLCGKTLYQWLKSLPSGHFLTAIINSILNKQLHTMCWIKLHPEGVKALSQFPEKVYFIGYGDDSMCNVADDCLGFFNYETLGKAMADLGFDYTDELKTEATVLYRHVDELSFLKRGFRFEPILGRYVAPLSMTSILDMLYFTKKGADSQEITKTNVNNAFMELCMHSPEDFQCWAPRWLAGAREKLKYQPPVVNRVSLLRMVAQLDNYY